MTVPSLALEGWTACALQMPQRDALMRFYSELTGQAWTGRARDLHMDLTYVWHKETGISKKALEGAGGSK